VALVLVGGCMTAKPPLAPPAATLGPPVASPVAPATPTAAASVTPADPALAAAQARVDAVNQRLLRASAGHNLRPTFVVRANGPAADREGPQRVYLSNEVVGAAATEGQLAALMAWQLALLYVDRHQQLAAAEAANYREPMPDIPFSHDGGTIGEEQQRKVEIAKLGLDRKRRPPAPPPAPDMVARQILVQAGYSELDLDAVRPLLQALAPAQAINR
jgi:hypothetical protein